MMSVATVVSDHYETQLHQKLGQCWFQIYKMRTLSDSSICMCYAVYVCLYKCILIYINAIYIYIYIIYILYIYMTFDEV